MSRTWLRQLAPVLILLSLAAVVAFSNDYDWDHFLAFFEVELRSWFIDFHPPLWTYQLCSGVTRIGDPQSFGLSPLFLPVLLFGSFWGSKILIMGCAVLGYVYLARILALLDPVADEDSVPIHRSLSLFFICGDYLLWHFEVGHVTFALVPFSFVPAYYFAKGCLRGLDRWEGIAFFIAAQAYLSAGVYHSLMFFVLPTVALVALGGILYGSRRRAFGFRGKPIGQTSLIAIAAVACSSYKWLEVLRYQRLYPRVLTDSPPEVNPLWHLFVYFLVPTWHRAFAGTSMGWGPWMFYEYAAFSLIPWALLVVIGVRWLAKRRGERETSPTWGLELGICALVAIMLCLGDSSPIPIFGALNEWVFHDSMRVVGRFEITLLALMLVYLQRLLAASAESRRVFVKFLAPVGLALLFLNNLTFFAPGQLARFREVTSVPGQMVDRMNTLVLVRSRDLKTMVGESFMYPAVQAGGIVLNCYQPLSREMVIGTENGLSPAVQRPTGATIDLLNPGPTPVSERCRQSAYVTQSEVHYNREACPSDLCFNVNGLNIYSEPPLKWNPDRHLLCLK